MVLFQPIRSWFQGISELFLNQFDYNSSILGFQNHLEPTILILIKGGLFPNTSTYKFSFNITYNTRFYNNLANEFRGYDWGSSRLEPPINQFGSRNGLEAPANLSIDRNGLENPINKLFIFDDLSFLDVNISSLEFNIESRGQGGDK
jgi:hypothetical protein